MTNCSAKEVQKGASQKLSRPAVLKTGKKISCGISNFFVNDPRSL